MTVTFCLLISSFAQAQTNDILGDLDALASDIQDITEKENAVLKSKQREQERTAQLETALKKNETARAIAVRNANITEPPFSCKCFTSFCIGGGDPRRYSTPEFDKKPKAERDAIGARYDAKKKACRAYAALKSKVSTPYLERAKEIKAAFDTGETYVDGAELSAIVNQGYKSSLSSEEISDLDAALDEALRKKQSKNLIQDEIRIANEKKVERAEQEMLEKEREAERIESQRRSAYQKKIAEQEAERLKSCAATWARGVWPCGCPRPDELKSVNGAVCSK